MMFVTFWRVEDRACVGVSPTILKKDADFPRYKDFAERWKITLALSDFSDSIFKVIDLRKAVTIYCGNFDSELTAPTVESIIRLLYTFPISVGEGVMLFSSHHSISDSKDVAI